MGSRVNRRCHRWLSARNFRDMTRTVVRGSGFPVDTDEDLVEAWERLNTAIGNLEDCAVEALADPAVPHPTKAGEP